MRILHVVPTYLPATRYGGPIYSVHGLCKALVAHGHEVHVFTTNVDGAGNSDVRLGTPVPLDGVNVWYFTSLRLRRLYWSPQMMRTLRAEVSGFDLIHLHSVFLWPTWAAARVARACAVPYVLSPRGMLVRDLIRHKSRLLKLAWITLIERQNLRSAATIHVTSVRERADLDALNLGLSRIEVIPNGVDRDIRKGTAQVDPAIRAALARGPCALCLGRLSWKKGIDRLICAWNEVPDGHLIIAGNDDENLAARLRTLIVENHLGSRVTLLDRHVDADEKGFLFANVRVVVVPSYSENFGNVVIEAMAAGCPVIVTPEVGAAEVVAAAHGGWIVPEEGLAAALNAAMFDSTAARNKGDRACAFVSSNLTWETIAAHFGQLYARLRC